MPRSRRLVAVAGDTLVGLVFFGSRRTGAARTDAWSAYDVFVVVQGYRAFYEALRRGGLTGKSPALMALVSGWLPPTQFSLRFEDLGVHVKAASSASTRTGARPPRTAGTTSASGGSSSPRASCTAETRRRVGISWKASCRPSGDVAVGEALAPPELRREGLRSLRPADLDAVGGAARAHRPGRRPVGGAASPPGPGLRSAPPRARRAAARLAPAPGASSAGWRPSRPVGVARAAPARRSISVARSCGPPPAG